MRYPIGDEPPAEDGVLGAMLDRDGTVIARVSPEQKLRIARALRSRGHVVAMTGDGVNDGPALEEADIGIAMGRFGTDVAREASDLVLLDDNFGTIVAAVEQGRAAFGNIRRFLTYHLTDNVAELVPFMVWALSGGRFPLALGVLQILALDIGTDTLPAVALGAEPPAPRTLDGPPVRGRLLNRTVAIRALAIAGPIEALLGMCAFVLSLLASGWRPGEPFPTGPALLAASGATFATVVLGQMANAFACRSATRPPWRIGWLSNPLLIVAVVVELVFALGVCLFWPPLASMLGQAPPPRVGWLVAACAIPAIIVADAVFKRSFRRRLDAAHPVGDRVTGPDSAANSVGDRRRDPSRDGLTAEEAGARFDRIGPNEIPRGPRASWRRRFARQLLEPMALLLLVAAAVEGFGLGERLEAIAILAIVFLNAVIGTVQEGRAERALDALRSMEPRYATVVRDARRQRIDLARVVPGDIVVLAAGDRVPADIELLVVNGLQVDESVLTGESLPVDKLVPTTVGDADNGRAFAGTVVTNGDGLGAVVRDRRVQLAGPDRRRAR